MRLRDLLYLLLLLPAPFHAQTRQVDLKPADGWVDTGVDVNAHDTIKVTATGELQYTNAKQTNGPEGLARGFADLVRVFQFNDAGRGALIGRVGSSDGARPFLIGPQFSSQAHISGRLFVAINQSSMDQATGSYHLTIERTAAPAAAKAEITVPKFTQEMIDSIPRRVSDPNGAPGDRVNFVLIGSEQQVQEALKAAGWVVVDKTNQDAVLNGFLSSLSKQAYVTMPMSVLQLWDRGQDFGYAQADPLMVVASRHHFRIWKAPFELEGQTVWAGAGTHDIGFDRDYRTKNGITHKIDPKTDGERDYICDSLTQTGMIAKTDYITPTDPVLKAKTATGSEFTSDGRTLLVYFAKDSK
jgi:LssY C-terminus